VHIPARKVEVSKARERVWLFDLDNTLHDTSFKIFREINLGMTAAVMESLEVDEATATHLRTSYWKRYGATLIGLVRHHGVDAHQFLHRSHNFDVGPLIRAERGLAHKLRRLPGRKILVF
jgi:putative hydrolase of the HAD superfamily